MTRECHDIAVRVVSAALSLNVLRPLSWTSGTELKQTMSGNQRKTP